METQQEQKLIEAQVERPIVGLVAAYGTLRLNHGNWSYFLQGKSEHLGTYQTEPRYTMYGKHAGFPIVVDHRDDERKGTTAITYDLFAVYDRNVLHRIDGLEVCYYPQGDSRNWYDYEMIDTPHGEAKMYVMHKARGNGSMIQSGDWEQQD